MFITDLSIRRPVVSAVFSIILVVFGLFVFWKLPVRELPSGLQPPVVQVQVDYQGASAEIVSSEIVEIIEDVIGGAEGIKNIEYGKAFFALLNKANLSALDILLKTSPSKPKVISIYSPILKLYV